MTKLLAALFLLSPLAANATTYYIDFATGNDANAGTSKGSPWQHQPYMNNWAGTYSHAAGDRFIFKGGVSWPASCFGWEVQRGGSFGSPDYYGVDQTWFTGGSFTHPVIDGQSARETIMFIGTGTPYSATAHNLQFDQLDFKGVYWNRAINRTDPAVHFVLPADGTTNVMFSNLSFGPWSYGPSATTDPMVVCGGESIAPFNQSWTFTNVVVDGGPSNAIQSQSSGSFGPYGGKLLNCTFRNMVTILRGNPGVEVSHCNLGPSYVSFDAGQHDNIINFVAGGTHMVHDSYLHDSSSIGILINFNAGELDYIWNNLFYNATQNAMISIDTGNVDGAYNFWNNTIAPNSAFQAFRIVNVVSPVGGKLGLVNNHVIQNGANLVNYDPGASLTAVTNQNNILQTIGQASVTGYTPSNLWQPVQVTAPTAGAGQNLSTVLSGVLNTDLLGVARPKAQGWDVGAYEFAQTAAPAGNLSFSASGYSAAENGGFVVVTVNRTGGTAGAVSVNVATGGGTATPGHDYTANSGVLSWADGTTGARSFSIAILPSGDTALTNRTFNVTLSAATGGAVITGTNPAVVTIQMNPPPTQFVFTITSMNPASGVAVAATADANGAGAGATAFTRSYFQGASVTLVAPGTAGANTFTRWTKDGATLAATPSITVAADVAHTFSAVYGTPPPPAQFQLTVNSSPAAAIVTVAPADVNGAASGTAPFSRLYASNTLMSVSVPSAGFVKWQLDGGDYAVSAATNVLMGAAHSLLAIYAATNGGTIALSAPSYAVQSTGGSVTVTVQPAGSSNVQRTVHYSTADASAVAGTDYTAASGTLTFAANSNVAQTVNVPVTNTGAIGGPNRIFSFHLDSPTGGAALGLSQALVTIVGQTLVGVQGTLKFTTGTTFTGGIILKP